MTPKLYYSDITGQISHERVDPSQDLYHHDSVVKDLVEALKLSENILSLRDINTSLIIALKRIHAALAAVEGE